MRIEVGDRFRRDLNGLRAVAVLSVLCFHFGIAPFRGGFIGVDVFFVISGYLMTRILASQIEDGRLDIFRFYFGRMLRIVPALLVTIVATLAITSVLLLPAQFLVAAREAIHSALFTVNIYFAGNTSYFAPAAAQSWFLHCWSLAVEIQFYLLIPLFLMASHWISPRRGLARFAI